jgi:XTP/dITP diphosphohydrolase
MAARMLFASRNDGKARELGPLLREHGISLLSLRDVGIAAVSGEDTIECFDTFEDNALAKARWFLERSEGLPVLADDSGLEILALGRRPGVRSKRWAGREDLAGRALDAANNATMLEELRTLDAASGLAVGSGEYAAQFVCAAACVWPTGAVVERAVSGGCVVQVAIGAEGFGYDPYFRSTELGVTFGEAGVALKNWISHRGRAFRTLLTTLLNDPACAAWFGANGG